MELIGEETFHAVPSPQFHQCEKIHGILIDVAVLVLAELADGRYARLAKGPESDTVEAIEPVLAGKGKICGLLFLVALLLVYLLAVERCRCHGDAPSAHFGKDVLAFQHPDEGIIRSQSDLGGRVVAGSEDLNAVVSHDVLKYVLVVPVKCLVLNPEKLLKASQGTSQGVVP